MNKELKSTLGANGRMSFPSKLRFGASGRYVIAQAFDVCCLQIYSEEHWDEFERKLLENNELDDAEFYLRFMDKRNIEVDEQGRFFIEPSLREYAKLETDVYFKTVGKKVELWNRQELDKTMEQTDRKALRARMNLRFNKP